MKITAAKFITSAADKKGFITTDKPIICVAGKSNVGKSSFINMLANQKKLAKTSNTPGRTRLVNYFDFGDFVIADLPGYGFAKVGKEEKRRWSVMLNDFFELTDICHTISLVDIRHNPTEEDIMMIKMLYARILPFTVVATKSDKLSKTRIKPRISEIAANLGLASANIISVSNQSGAGKQDVLAVIENAINCYNDGSSDK